jgi:hypothetical protein
VFLFLKLKDTFNLIIYGKNFRTASAGSSSKPKRPIMSDEQKIGLISGTIPPTTTGWLVFINLMFKFKRLERQ